MIFLCAQRECVWLKSVGPRWHHNLGRIWGRETHQTEGLACYSNYWGQYSMQATKLNLKAEKSLKRERERPCFLPSRVSNSDGWFFKTLFLWGKRATWLHWNFKMQQSLSHHPDIFLAELATLVLARTTDPHPYGVWSDWFASITKSSGQLLPTSVNFQSDKHHNLESVECSLQNEQGDIWLTRNLQTFIMFFGLIVCRKSMEIREPEYYTLIISWKY